MAVKSKMSKAKFRTEIGGEILQLHFVCKANIEIKLLQFLVPSKLQWRLRHILDSLVLLSSVYLGRA